MARIDLDIVCAPLVSRTTASPNEHHLLLLVLVSLCALVITDLFDCQIERTLPALPRAPTLEAHLCSV